MPNDVEVFHMGLAAFNVWDIGWQRSPWSGAEVHGAKVQAFLHGHEYGPVKFYDSIANGQAGKSVNLREAAATVADELVSYYADPDEFITLVLDDVNAANFDEKTSALTGLKDSKPIGRYLYALTDGDGEWFENWAATDD